MIRERKACESCGMTGQGIRRTNGPERVVLECHAMPPYADAYGTGVWPEVVADEWCAKWKPKK